MTGFVIFALIEYPSDGQNGLRRFDKCGKIVWQASVLERGIEGVP
jgi:hypothetical protein